MTGNPVETHYTRTDLGEAILAALKAAGKDLDHLSPDDLAPVDEFHGGQRPATVRLAELVGFTGTERVLDVGSGLGGPSRWAPRRRRQSSVRWLTCSTRSTRRHYRSPTNVIARWPRPWRDHRGAIR